MGRVGVTWEPEPECPSGRGRAPAAAAAGPLAHSARARARMSVFVSVILIYHCTVTNLPSPGVVVPVLRDMLADWTERDFSFKYFRHSKH